MESLCRYWVGVGGKGVGSAAGECVSGRYSVKLAVGACDRDRRCGAIFMHARTARHGRLGLGLGLGLGCYLRACTHGTARQVRVRARVGVMLRVLSSCMHGTARRGADLQRHDYLRSVESCVVVVELSRLAQVREELACSQDRKYT